MRDTGRYVVGNDDPAFRESDFALILIGGAPGSSRPTKNPRKSIKTAIIPVERDKITHKRVYFPLFLFNVSSIETCGILGDIL